MIKRTITVIIIAFAGVVILALAVSTIALLRTQAQQNTSNFNQDQAQARVTTILNAYRETAAAGNVDQAKTDLTLTHYITMTVSHHIGYWVGSRDPVLCTNGIPSKLYVFYVRDFHDSVSDPYYYYVTATNSETAPGGVYVGVDPVSGSIIDLSCDS